MSTRMIAAIGYYSHIMKRKLQVRVNTHLKWPNGDVMVATESLMHLVELLLQLWGPGGKAGPKVTQELPSAAVHLTQLLV